MQSSQRLRRRSNTFGMPWKPTGGETYAFEGVGSLIVLGTLISHDANMEVDIEDAFGISERRIVEQE